MGASLFLKSRLINLAMFSYLILCYLSFLMAVIYCVLEHFFERNSLKKEANLSKIND